MQWKITSSYADWQDTTHKTHEAAVIRLFAIASELRGRARTEADFASCDNFRNEVGHIGDERDARIGVRLSEINDGKTVIFSLSKTG